MGDSERRANNTNSRTSNGRSVQAHEVRYFQGVSLKPLVGHPTESGFPSVLPHWTFDFTDETLHGVLPQMNVDYMRPSPSHDTLLSSMTVFRDSIHIGSISPSSKIHLGPSWEMLASSLMMEEKSPVRNHRWLLFQHWPWLSSHSFPALATILMSCNQTGQTQLCILLYREPDTCV